MPLSALDGYGAGHIIPNQMAANKLRKLADEKPGTGEVIMNGNRMQIKRKPFEKIIGIFGYNLVKKRAAIEPWVCYNYVGMLRFFPFPPPSVIFIHIRLRNLRNRQISCL